LSTAGTWLLRSVADNSQSEATDELAEYVWNHAERVGVETIAVPLPRAYHTDEITITNSDVIEDEPRGSCYGRQKPDPEPQWRDI
jgi:hypothetical protein